MRVLGWIVLLLAAFAAPAQAQENWAGDWHGALSLPGGQQLRLIVTVHALPEGGYRGELESVDQAPGQKVPLDSIAIADGRMTFALARIQASYEGRWEPEANRFAGTFTQGGNGLPLDLARAASVSQPVIPGLDGVWETRIERNGAELRLILRVATSDLGTVALFDSPDMLASGLPVTGLAREGEGVRFEVPAGQTSFQGTLSADGARLAGRWSRVGQPDIETAFVRRDPATANAAPNRPQEPRPPFPYRAEEVRIPNPRASEVTLAGTLTLPLGEGPFPAAILISGSGPQDRDETVFGHRPFAVLADHLTRRGIAVLRYDDRGTAQSTGRFSGATSADFATDAAAAFAWLAARPEIDRRAIGYIGHSEGGMVAPLAAPDSPGLGFVILLAGPGTDILTLMEGQRRALGRTMGLSEAELDQSAAIQARVMEIGAGDLPQAEARAAILAIFTDEALAESGITPPQRDMLTQRALDPWFRWFLRYDPTSALRALTMPVLALNGSLDVQVLPGSNLEGIRAALADNPDVTIGELPGLNHMFQTARTGAMGEYADIEETMAPAALDAVSDWVAARFPPPGRR